jgi:hypothetical protein
VSFLGRDQVVGVDVLETDEDVANARLCRLLDEIRNLVTERVDLNREYEIGEFRLAQMDDPIEQHFPVAVAREIVVRDDEAADVLRMVFADDSFDVVGCPAAALAALHIDDRAERTLVGTAAAEIHA